MPLSKAGFLTLGFALELVLDFVLELVLDFVLEFIFDFALELASEFTLGLDVFRQRDKYLGACAQILSGDAVIIDPGQIPR